MISEKGRTLHGQAENAREKEQNFLKSLTLLDEAIIAYQNDNDPRGVSEALQSRSTAFKHLYQQTSNEVYLTLALYNSLAGVKIAESLEDTSGLAMAYRGLAKIFEQTEDWRETENYFTKAIAAFDKNPPTENNHPAIRSDMKAHLAYAKYLAGDKSTTDMMNQAISELEASDMSKYERDVWLSGAHMRAAQMLKVDNTQLAHNHLAKAKEIIDANPELVIRKEQWEELNNKFN